MNITGEKKQNFEQGRLLIDMKKTYGNTAAEQEIVRSIEGGICYMLSIEWLLKLLDNPAAYPDSIFDNDFGNPKVLAYYKQIANNYHQFSIDFNHTFDKRAKHSKAEIATGGSIIDMDKKYVGYCSKNRHKVLTSGGPFNSSTDITSMFGENSALLVYLNVIPDNPSIKGFAHEMALWKYGGKSWFYDPNMGVFMLKDFSRIIGEILNGYKVFAGGAAQAYITITQLN